MRRALLLALLLLGCGPRPLQTGPTVPTLVQVGGDRRAVRTLTDLDDVRDVSASRERVFVATDLGLLVHPANGAAPPERLTTAHGLPSNDVRVVAATPDGRVVAATAAGLVTIDGDRATGMAAPPVGEVVDLLADDGGTLWACGTEGVGRLGTGGWERFGEPAVCTTLVPTPEGDLWVGTTRGLWHVSGDVVREHGQGVLPEAHVRDVVPVGPGEVMALLQGPGDSRIGYFDGDRWYGYTIADFEPAAVGLAGVGGMVLLVTPDRAYAIAPAEAAEDGFPLTPLSRSEPRRVVGYRARITPASDVRPAEGGDRSAAVRPPSPLARVPTGLPSLEAPAFVVSNVDIPVGSHVYLVRRQPGALYVAGRNLGVTAIDAQGRATALRSNDLVREQDLQLAASPSGTTWTIGTHHDPARWQGDGLVRAPVPDGIVPQAIASGPRGVYVAAMVERAAEAPAAEQAPPAPGAVAPPGAAPAAAHEAPVRIYRVSDEGWTQLTEKTIRTATPLVATPFLGVTNDEEFWLGLRIVHENGEGSRMRGVAVFRPDGDVTYHHRGADPATDGEGALRMPDEVTGVDLGHAGHAWLPSLSGAVRVGNSQAVVFGEARGVRGEVVTDVATEGERRVWVAAAEGLGYREGGSFEFRLPHVVQQARPTSLALDAQGHLWGAGPNGAVYHDGERWQTLTVENGLPTNELVDVEVDEQNRVWFLARDRVVLFSQPQQPAGGIGGSLAGQ